MKGTTKMRLGDSKGSAQKATLNSYKFKNGLNRLRVFGALVPRYMYWLPDSTGKDSPTECLAFNRELEEFDNREKDWVAEYYPDKRASWSYAMLCVDLENPSQGALILNWKKKLFGQVLNTVEDLGDPSDLDQGWDIVFTKEKTGPKTINVEYQLQQLKCKKGAASDEVKAVAEAATPIEELLPRITPEKQKEYLDRMRSGGETTEDLPDEIKENMALIS